jgi:small-conductance mechanosensitive channel
MSKLSFRDMMHIFHRLAKAHRRRILRNVILLVPGIAGDILIHYGMIQNEHLARLLGKFSAAYITVILVAIFNSILVGFLDVYSKSEKSRHHPLKGVVQGAQVVLHFIGAIVVTAALIGKSPTVLLTGLGASAAVLMLIFKDSILGLVGGIQLSQNDMIRIGDWIQTTDSSANGIVEEITLNTVKVRNWDNTISTIPPYTLVSTPFRNWRGMTESGGRRVDKRIFLDITTIESCTEDMLADARKNIPLLADYQEETSTNSQLYRAYIVRYLRSQQSVAQSLDLIIAQREPTEYGLPIEVYFFLTEKEWDKFEKIQSDIFDHLIGMASEFGLKLYQAEG